MTNLYTESDAAERYDSARTLPAETTSIWLKALSDAIPEVSVKRILDLGCGTGRFTEALSTTFDCDTIGVDPSAAMLKVATAKGAGKVEWKHGSAEDIPLPDHSVDLVFMSQVFHHFSRPSLALQEIARVLTPGGHLALRNGTREHNAELEWLKFFPTAAALEDERMPSADRIKTIVTNQGFHEISHQTIWQVFASSHAEYFEKISKRGLSSLIAISDDEFESGLEKFKNWVALQPEDVNVYEPVDLFVFRKS